MEVPSPYDRGSWSEVKPQISFSMKIHGTTRGEAIFVLKYPGANSPTMPTPPLLADIDFREDLRPEVEHRGLEFDPGGNLTD